MWVLISVQVQAEHFFFPSKIVRQGSCEPDLLQKPIDFKNKKAQWCVRNAFLVPKFPEREWN